MLCLYVLHLCLLPKRPEEGVRSLELESRWLEAAIRGYWQSNLGLWGMLGIKPWSSVRASCALHVSHLFSHKDLIWGWRVPKLLNELTLTGVQSCSVSGWTGGLGDSCEDERAGKRKKNYPLSRQSPWIKEQMYFIALLEKIRRTLGSSKKYQFHLCFPFSLLVVHNKTCCIRCGLLFVPLGSWTPS